MTYEQIEHFWVVRYNGFLGEVVRKFSTRERAIQWARMAGKYPCNITKEINTDWLYNELTEASGERGEQ